jgi:catechol 2,3-dioxygenase-like lactoylglutathione lyase family enzyme
MLLLPHHVGMVVGDLERSTTFYGALGDKPFFFRDPDGIEIEIMQEA